MRLPSPTREFPASSLLLNYRPVLGGRIVLPRIGRPVAEMILKASPAASRPEPGQPVVLDLEYGPEFCMSVLSVLEDQGLWRLRLVGGTGGLSRNVEAKHYGRGTCWPRWASAWATWRAAWCCPTGSARRGWPTRPSRR